MSYQNSITPGGKYSLTGINFSKSIFITLLLLVIFTVGARKPAITELRSENNGVPSDQFGIPSAVDVSGPSDPPGEGCSEAIHIHEEPEEIFFEEGKEILWLFFEAPYDSIGFSATGISGIEFPEISSVTIFEGGECGSLNPIQTDNINIGGLGNLPGFSLIYTFIQPQNTYYLKLTRTPNDNGYPEAGIKKEIKKFNKSSCLFEADPCNLIGNGNFESVDRPRDANTPFQNDEVCLWKCAFPTPHIELFNNSFCAALFSGIHNNLSKAEGVLYETTFMQGQSYILTFEIAKMPSPVYDYSDNFKVALANSANSGLPITTGGVIAVPSLTSKQLVATVDRVNMSTSMDKFTFTFVADDDYDQIYFYPENDSTVESYMLLDNVSLAEFANAGPNVDNNCGPATIGPECTIPSATYSWSPSTGLSDPTIANPTANPSNSTNYILTVTYDDGTTIHTETDTVTVAKTGSYPIPDVTVTGVKNIEQVRQLYSNEISELNGQYTSSGYNFYIEKELIVNADFKMTDCNILLASGAKITVKNAANFEYLGNSSLQNNYIKSCGGQWDRIELKERASLTINHAHPFSHSTNGIVSLDADTTTIKNTDFDLNERCLHVDGSLGNSLSLTFKSNSIDYSSPVIINNDHYYPEHAIYIDEYTATSSLDFIIGDGLNIFNGRGGNIYLYKSNARITENIFEEFNVPEHIPGPPGAEVASKSSKAIEIVGDNSLINRVLSVNIERNHFLGCAGSIHLSGNIRSSINDNKMNILTDDLTPYPGAKDGYFCKILNSINRYDYNSVLNNEIIDVRDGVIFNNCQGVISISQNKITTDNVGTVYNLTNMGTGIKVNNSVNSALSLKSYINNNIIKKAKIGIDLSNCNNDILRVFENEISEMQSDLMSCTFSGCKIPSYGIRAINSKVIIAGNTVEYENFQTSKYLHGLAIFNSSFEIRCNTITNTGVALLFSGANNELPNSYQNSSNDGITANQFVDNENTIVLINNGTIGQMGNQTIGFTNGWAYVNNLSPNSHLLSDNSPGYLSPLYFHSALSVYKPSPFINIAINQGTPFITVDGNPRNSLSCSMTFPISPSGTDTTAFIYDSLKLDPLGKVIDGSENLSSRKLHPFDLEHAKINDIYDQYLQYDSLSSQDSDHVRELASSCPYYKGFAVYKARDLMMQLGEYHFTNECEIISDPVSKKARRTKEMDKAEENIRLYPNPTKNDLQVEIPEGLEQAQIVFYNVQGSKVKVETLNGTHSRINLSALNSGIYLYQIVREGEIFSTGKVQLMK